MSVEPKDLVAVRKVVMALTGVTSAGAIGIVGNAQHKSGYHLGRDRLKKLGILDSDFSVDEFTRDRDGLTNSASALDITLSWKIGGHAPDGKPQSGRKAAIRFSNLIVAELRNKAPGSEVLRAINWSVDGSAKIRDDPKIGKKRVDRRAGLSKTSTSTDTVDSHTHFEFFRDTEGSRDGAFLTLLRRCILQAQGRDDDMLRDEKVKGADGKKRSALTALFDLHNEMILGHDFGRKDGAVNRLIRVERELAAAAKREDALATAFQGLAASRGVNTEAILKQINQVAEAESATVKALQDRIAELIRQLDDATREPDPEPATPA